MRQFFSGVLMGLAGGRLALPLSMVPMWGLALSLLLCHGNVRSALPPAASETEVRKVDGNARSQPSAAPAGSTEPDDQRQETSWVMPPLRFDGNLSYMVRSDTSEGQTRMRNGMTATLNASTSTFIWQPWFARLNANLGLSLSRDGSNGPEAASASQNVIVTGAAQLMVLTQSPYPFEAHFVRTDSRTTSDLVRADLSAGQRYGFTQHYYRPDGEAMIGFESDTHTGVDAGRDRQRSLRMNVTHTREHHRVQLTGDGAWNAHEPSGEDARQGNLSLQHSYTPSSAISAESMLNISRVGFHLRRGDGDTRLMQLGSMVFWRPADSAMTVNGGARVFALAMRTTNLPGADDTTSNRIRNAVGNANVGLNYTLNRHTRLTAGINLNVTSNNGERSANSSQTVGASYQPDELALGAWRYGWSTSANFANRTGGQDAGRELTWQVGHSLSRDFKLAGGSSVRVGAGQSLAQVSNGRSRDGEAASNQQLTHSGSLSWEKSLPAGAMMVQFSFSDSRALSGPPEFIQMANLQASSSLPTSGQSSWSGSLTIQAVRQSANVRPEEVDPFGPQGNPFGNTTSAGNDFVITSSGAISYQNQRVFGVRRLRFSSELRLNSDAFLPLLGSARDEQLTSWDNRLDYLIGRTQLRLITQISSSRTPKFSADALTGTQQVKAERKTQRSIALSASRSF